MRHLIVVAPLLLAACAPSSGGPPTSKLTPPPKEWLAPAARLPNTPACEEEDTATARIDCRAKYDRTVRASYVSEAKRREALASYVRTLLARK